MDKFRKHLKNSDPILYEIYLKTTIDEDYLTQLEERRSENFFKSLCDEIISQQLSSKVANVIFDRFINLYPNGDLTPKKLLETKDETLRSCGISFSKIKYLKDLAEKVNSGELNLEMLPQLSNEEVIEELTKVKGIGVWTAEMFLMFSLGREDIFSHGDLGLKNAIKKIYKLENPTREEVEIIVTKWSPYRSYACKILWRSLSLKEPF